MIYISIFIMTFIISGIIKLFLYTNKNKDFLTLNLYIITNEKKLLLIDIFLAVIYLFLYNKYSFSVLFFSNVILIAALLLISIIDVRSKIIPNKLIIMIIAVGVITLVLDNNSSIINALLGFIICGGIIAIISFITKGDIGMGDAKLFACIGIFFGLQTTLGIMLTATMISGLAGLTLLALGKANRKTVLPFAPFVFAVTMFVIIS